MSPVLSQTTATPYLLLLAALSALVGLMLLSALCTICKRKRRKKKKKNILSDGVMLVDVSLLRQTQLRSLSKSDTKLHELKSIRFKETSQRPVSMDFFYPSMLDRGGQRGPSDHVSLKRELPKIPLTNPRGDRGSPNHTYSNLKPTLEHKPRPCIAEIGEVVTTRAEPQLSPTPPTASRTQEDTVTAEYACVKKLKKCTPMEPQDQGERGNLQALSQDSRSLLVEPQVPPAKGPEKKLEDMYSTVCKLGKKKRPQELAASIFDNVAPGCPTRPLKPESKAEHPPSTALSWPTTHPQPAVSCYEPDRERAGPSNTSLLVPEPAYEEINLSRREGRAEQKDPHENLYESISEAREAQPGATRVLKTYNGLETYLTGL